MIDPALEAAFASTATAKIPGKSYSPRLPIGDHTVIIKQMNRKNTQGKGPMVNLEVVVLESTTANLSGEGRSWAWFTGADKYGIQDGFLREFLEAVGTSIGSDESTPRLAAALAGVGQAGRGMQLKVSVRAQVNGKTGQLKINPKDNQPYTEAHWYPVSQTLEEVAQGRAALDADPKHAVKFDQAPGQTMAPPTAAVTQAVIAPPAAPAAPVAAPAAAPAAPAGGLGLLASLKK